VKYGGYDPMTYDEVNALLPGGLGHEFGLNVLFAFDHGYEGNEPGIVGPGQVSNIFLNFKYGYCTDLICIVWNQNDVFPRVLLAEQVYCCLGGLIESFDTKIYFKHICFK
jgi:hypothetical protein